MTMNTGTLVRLKSGGQLMTVRCKIDERASVTGREPGVVCNWLDPSGVPHEMTFLAEQLKEIER